MGKTFVLTTDSYTSCFCCKVLKERINCKHIEMRMKIERTVGL